MLDNDSSWAWPMRSAVGILLSHILSFYPFGWKSVSELWAWSESELPPSVQVIIRALFVQVEERRALAFTPHWHDSCHITWFQMVWQITWQQGHPESPACETRLEEPGVKNISPLPAGVFPGLLGWEVSTLLGYQEMQKCPWRLDTPMSVWEGKLKLLCLWDSLHDLLSLSA